MGKEEQKLLKEIKSISGVTTSSGRIDKEDFLIISYKGEQVGFFYNKDHINDDLFEPILNNTLEFIQSKVKNKEKNE